jgi:hypothetical protein
MVLITKVFGVIEQGFSHACITNRRVDASIYGSKPSKRGNSKNFRKDAAYY